MNALLVTWAGGGATKVAIGLGRRLADNGHRVRILGPADLADRVLAAGCEHRAFPARAEFDASRGRAVEDQFETYSLETMFGAAIPGAVAAEVERDPPDLVVCDYLLRSVLCRIEALGFPLIVLMHMAYRFHGVPFGDPDEPWGWRWQRRRLNEVRAGLGLELIPFEGGPMSITLAARAAATLVAIPSEFDAWPDPPPAVVHVGHIREEAGAPEPWAPPWPGEDARPLAVITMGSTYMHQEELLGRVVAALADGWRVLVLTGHELDPGELPGWEGVAVARYVPHAAVFPHADLVVTHGGMGTLMAAFAEALPVLCVPLGRDQEDNAQSLVELGAGVVLDADAEPAEIRRAADELLSAEAPRAAARRMGEAIAGYGDGAIAVREVERVAQAAGAER
jgi:UDP:flavonoid glycosyltransferase YjiC (YdhE family)